MARNASLVLSAAQVTRSNIVRARVEGILSDDLFAGAQEVTVAYVKRDGAFGEATGTILGIVGTDDKEAMTLVTPKGYRSVNLWNVLTIK